VANIASRGGHVMAEGKHIRIQEADEVVILTAMATGVESDDPTEWAKKHLAREYLTFEELRDRHVTDHQRLFRRVQLLLDNPEPERSTEQLIEKAIQTKRGSVGLVEKLVHFGRYLLISGSRPGGLPMNLQGIWNDQVHPPWDSDYHMDLNLEFNYWP